MIPTTTKARGSRVPVSSLLSASLAAFGTAARRRWPTRSSRPPRRLTARSSTAPPTEIVLTFTEELNAAEEPHGAHRARWRAGGRRRGRPRQREGDAHRPAGPRARALTRSGRPRSPRMTGRSSARSLTFTVTAPSPTPTGRRRRRRPPSATPSRVTVSVAVGAPRRLAVSRWSDERLGRRRPPPDHRRADRRRAARGDAPPRPIARRRTA